MKAMDTETLKTLREMMPSFTSEHKKEESVRIDAATGTVLHPHILHKDEAASEGDMMVVYQSRSAVADRYREAIRALDLKEAEAERFLDFDRLETFRRALEYRLDKAKLWNYAPDQRDEVKAARTFLKTLLATEIPYGETVFVPKEEIETFLADEANRFGVEAYYYCLQESLPHLDQARETVAQLGHRIETLMTEPIHKVQHLAEAVITKIPDPIDTRIRLMSA